MIDKATLWVFMKEFIYAGIKGIIMKYGAYEPNNRQTWENISARANEFIENLVPLRFLHEAKIVCDNTTNTQDTVDANEFHLKFAWKVNENDEFTIVDFDLMPLSGLMMSEVSNGIE